MSPSFLVLLAALFTLTLSINALNLHIDSFDANVVEKSHWLFGSLSQLAEGETFQKTDRIQFALKNPTTEVSNMPKISHIYAAFFDNLSGTQLATFSLNGDTLKDNSMQAPATLEWTDYHLDDPLTQIDFAMEVFYHDAPGTSLTDNTATIVMQYLPTSTPTVSVEFPFSYRTPLATVVHFNATCTLPREDCIVLPYQVSMIHLAQNLTQITYSVRGAVNLEVDDPDTTKLNCWVNNHPVVAVLGGYKGRGTYTIEYPFQEGLDYDINCPKSAVVNGYDRQEDSVMWLTGHIPVVPEQGNDTRRASQTNFFTIVYDQSNIVIYSNTQSIARFNDYIFTAQFPISQSVLPDGSLLDSALAQISFSNSKPDYLIYYLTDEKNQVLESQILHPTKGEFDYFKLSFYGKSSLNFTVSARFESSSKESYDENISTIQTAFELQYDSIPFGTGAHPSVKVVTHAIADAPIVKKTLASSDREFIDQVGMVQQDSFDTPYIRSPLHIPVNEDIVKLFVDTKTPFDMTFTLPSSRSHFHLPEDQTEQNFICTMGLFEIKTKLYYDDAKRSLPLEFKNVNLDIPKTDQMPSFIRCSGNNTVVYPVNATAAQTDVFYDNLHISLAISPTATISQEFIRGYLALKDVTNVALDDEFDLYSDYHDEFTQFLLTLDNNDDDDDNNQLGAKKPPALSVQNYRIRFKKAKKQFWTWAFGSMVLILASISASFFLFLILNCCCKKSVVQHPHPHLVGVNDTTYQQLQH